MGEGKKKEGGRGKKEGEQEEGVSEARRASTSDSVTSIVRYLIACSSQGESCDGSEVIW